MTPPPRSLTRVPQKPSSRMGAPFPRSSTPPPIAPRCRSTTSTNSLSPTSSCVTSSRRARTNAPRSSCASHLDSQMPKMGSWSTLRMMDYLLGGRSLWMGREARRRASLSGSGRLGLGRRLSLRLSGRSRFPESSLGLRHIKLKFACQNERFFFFFLPGVFCLLTCCNFRYESHLARCWDHLQ